MGIHDRDYYRNDGPSVFDSLMPTGLVCRWLIGINVAVFLLQLVARTAAGPMEDPNSLGWVTDWLILNTSKVWDGQVWRLLTYAFLHSPDTPFHILFNMLFLWWFGSDIEQLYGRREFLLIYLVSAFSGGVVYQLWSLTQPHPSLCLGASGAVTTMLVLCACHFPRRVIYVFLILPMPIWLFAVLNIAQDVFRFVSNQQGGVAVSVHLAGAAVGLAYFKWQFNFANWFQGLMWWQHVRTRPRLKLYDPAPPKEEPVAVSATSTAVAMDEHLEAKLDAVLEKIAKTGKDSLTQQEQAILQQAAEMYKRRRS